MTVNPKQRRQLAMLLVLGVVLATVVVWQFGSSASAPPDARPPRQGAPATGVDGKGSAPAGARGGRGTAPTAAIDPAALEIRLAQLEAIAPEPSEGSRDPFRFRPAPPPPPPAAARPGAGGPGGTMGPSVRVPVEPSGPPVPAPPPPITLKFIGTLSQTDSGRIAVLSDGKFVYYGREGDMIEGRYRIVKIGEESIQLEYLDGRGRQTIRLSGS